jgi:hypothetical protein
MLKHGIPSTSEVIFDNIRNRIYNGFDEEKMRRLIQLDIQKYSGKFEANIFPSNIFAIQIIIKLVKDDNEEAKELLFRIVQHPNFAKRDQYYDLFELMDAFNVPARNPNFTYDLLRKIDLISYLNKIDRDSAFDKSKVLGGLIMQDWDSKRTRGAKIIHQLLKSQRPTEITLQFIGGLLSKLLKHNPIKTYHLFEKYLTSKRRFRTKFERNEYTRQIFLWLAEELAKARQFAKAKRIITLCIDDRDPTTSNLPDTFNYHLQVKNGEDPHLITSVRGTVPWALQKLVLTNSVENCTFGLSTALRLLDLNGSLARKLGYPEPDHYVRLQAMVPLVELAHPFRRKKLFAKIGSPKDLLKKVAFDILQETKKDIEVKGHNPRAILRRLVLLFSKIRELDTKEAKRLLSFMEDQRVAEAAPLLIYFALYRESHFKDIPFNSAYFKKRLEILCKSDEIFRPKLAFEFWRVINDKTQNAKELFGTFEKYWILLFDHYGKSVFDDLYRFLEVTLKWPEKYDAHILLLKKAFVEEAKYHKGKRDVLPYWAFGYDIGEVIIKRNIEDFLEVFNFLLQTIDENMYSHSISKWIATYKSIAKVPNNSLMINRDIKRRLAELYPEKFHNFLS